MRKFVYLFLFCFLLGTGEVCAGTTNASEWKPLNLTFGLTDGGDDDDDKDDDDDNGNDDSGSSDSGDDRDISIEFGGVRDGTIATRSLSQPVSAYQQGSVVMVMLDVPVSGATVTIYNVADDVAVRTESMIGPGQLELDLSGEDLGEYRLRIAIGENVWEGYFSL